MRLELTRRADYGIRAMLALARSDAARLSASHIAAAMQIPVRFLPQVMADLVSAGFVTAQVGRTGGYVLTEAGRESSVLAVVEAVEGDSRRWVCVLRGGPCGGRAICEVHDLFAGAHEALRSQLAAAKIMDLASAATPATTPGDSVRGALDPP